MNSFKSFARSRRSRDDTSDAADEQLPSDGPRRRSDPASLPLRDRNKTWNTMNGRLVFPGAESQTDRRGSSPVQDELGLRVIYRPHGERRADLIFVHGLGGSSMKTWSKNRDLEYCWPLKFLPNEHDINTARISTFGYNANFKAGSGATHLSVLDFAKDLLYDLRYAQDEQLSEAGDLKMGEQPIIFVVHSMGGLVVKEAYMQGQNDPNYRKIIKSVTSIVFLSTPHRGTNLAETLNRILRVTFLSSPKQFITELSTGSETIKKLNEQFRHVAPKLQIVSFYETKPTVVLKNAIMVLEKDSAVLGYPGEISKALDADHHQVCKFDSPDDPSYIAVRNVLKSLVCKSSSKPSKAEPNPLSEIESAFNFEEYLRVDPWVDDYNFFRDRWTPGTCDWILNREIFNEWLEDPMQHSRVLWIYGNAASGKSTLSSFIINYLTQMGLPCHYFFIRFSSQKKRSLSMILRSLACQLAQTIPEYAEKVCQLADANTDIRTADFRYIWQWLFKQSLLQFNTDTPVYLVLDGIDESEAPGSLIRLLSDLQSASKPLRVLVVSRRTHEISSSFQRLGREVQVDTVHIDGNRDDFRCYIDLEMNDLDRDKDDSLRNHVTHQLLARSQGNFLWVYLAVQKINACYTRAAVEDALENLPPGMEALYDRMATAIQSLSETRNGKLGQRILKWATCAHRTLSVEELSDALDSLDILEIQRAVDDLCGGFVVVDKEGKVALIHETAREYLAKSQDCDRPFVIDYKATHDMLFKSCLQRLTNNKLRTQVVRNQPPALLDYASNTWFIHFTSGSITDPENLEVLIGFLEGPHILTWVHIAAWRKQLRALVTASRCLTDVVIKLRRLQFDDCLKNTRTLNLVEGWATDLVKIVGKFGTNMISTPDAIYKLIPPFCPKTSVTYRQFGHKEAKSLQVSGLTSTNWDDCLARFPLDSGVIASGVLPAGSRIAILTNIRRSSRIMIHHAATFEEQCVLEHPERVFKIQVNKLGNLLVSYGYLTTRLWNTKTGECLKSVKNPPKKPRPHTIRFIDKDSTVLVGGEDRIFRYFSIAEDDPQWHIKIQIDEEIPEDAVVMFPTCSSLSPDGKLVVFGYRQHPVTLWDLEKDMLLGTCSINLSEADMTTVEATYGEVYAVKWHPFNGEVYGLTLTGMLFRWDTQDDEANDKVESGGDYLTVSQKGSLLGTGDGVGTIKIFASPDLSLLYQLSSQDAVLNLAFSADSRRLYDIRGQYANVWEPNTLMRLADDSEFPDHGSDSLSEIESLTKFSLQSRHQSARVDNVTTLAGQSVGPLYCYGTEDGIAVLCDVDSGSICELERLSSFMSIEHVAWSEDDKVVAISDLSGTILIKRVIKAKNQQCGWDVVLMFDILIPSSKGHIGQLIFHPAGKALFAFTPLAVFSINLETRIVTESRLPATKLKWVCHSAMPDYLLGFGTSKMYVYACEGLQNVRELSYSPPRNNDQETQSADEQRRGRFRKDNETVNRIVASPGSPHILLSIWKSTSTGCFENQFLLFKVPDISVGTTAPGTLLYTLIPEELSSRIKVPLAFLSPARLLFLDVDRWIGSSRITPPAKATQQSRRTSDTSTVVVDPYYFLPSDWATGNEAQLCSVMPDGTLLCPRNGEVAAVHSSKLRKHLHSVV